MSETVMCGKPAAFVLTGIGSQSVRVCVDCAEKGQAIACALGCPVSLDPDVPEGAECEQRIARRRAEDSQ